MDPVTIALLAGTAIKGISSLIKNRKGAKMRKQGESQMNKAISGIKYSRPDEYGQIMNILGQRESTLDTRKRMVTEDIRRSTAAGISGVRQLADSPVAALGAYGGLKEREQNAIADLGVQFESKRDEAMLGLAKGYEMGAGYSEKEQYYNDMYKKMLYANLGAKKMEAGRNMEWEGAEGLMSAPMDFLGTKYLSDTLNPALPSGEDYSGGAAALGAAG